VKGPEQRTLKRVSDPSGQHRRLSVRACLVTSRGDDAQEGTELGYLVNPRRWGMTARTVAIRDSDTEEDREGSGDDSEDSDYTRQCHGEVSRTGRWTATTRNSDE
jgi:hypothetical protein